jgi:hypothetical protein
MDREVMKKSKQNFFMEWHVSMSCTPYKLLDQTHRPWGPTLEILQKPWQECLDIFLTSFIENEHPYSDVNIIYSVVQTGERTTDWGTNSAPNIKRLCNGEYRSGQLHTIQSSSPRYHWCRCTCTMYKTGCIKDGGKRYKYICTYWNVHE